MAGIYIHIPFCKQACYYCDFHFSTSLAQKENLLRCLQQELHVQKDYLGGAPIETVYLGGGTPSILSQKELGDLLNTVRALYAVSPQAEITLEANPDDLSLTHLQELYQLGINRLSIGIQSFNNGFLHSMNRAHNAEEALAAIHLARQAGFSNISADLIYAFPHSDHSLWQADLQQMLAFRPEHISAYCLTVEEKTVLGKWTKKGSFQPADEEFAAHQFEQLQQALAEAGYIQYEVSNFCLPGYESKHNSNYWKQTPYLGIGPSAHSYDGHSRQYNISNNALYCKSIEKGELPCEKEILSQENAINEYLMTNLRTVWGCDSSFLEKQYDFQWLPEQLTYIQALVAKGLAHFEQGVLRLSPQGLLLADKIAADLFVEES
ncbi:radical SAM family heme chaperone HemW [Cytophagales bacterium LB-30]|uniref:Heme chaperone HemW n=1 Tax=Shiella aurantiaca TaxID=3058365 RepID=A0ABT8F6S0_9BACT|nr:radical SAM family heme chaperone HemW [Shiella aurantiaca]MDN4166155.1 radical SAM family heme chaperone HemW [Shiella aurantiaca]